MMSNLLFLDYEIDVLTFFNEQIISRQWTWFQWGKKKETEEEMTVISHMWTSNMNTDSYTAA